MPLEAVTASSAGVFLLQQGGGALQRCACASPCKYSCWCSRATRLPCLQSRDARQHVLYCCVFALHACTALLLRLTLHDT